MCEKFAIDLNLMTSEEIKVREREREKISERKWHFSVSKKMCIGEIKFFKQEFYIRCMMFYRA